MTTSPGNTLTSPGISPLPSPLLLPHSPRDAGTYQQGPSTLQSQHSSFSSLGPKKRVPSINTGFAGSEGPIVSRDNAYSPTGLLPSTSTISLLSLSFSKANLENEGVTTSIGSVLEEQGPSQQLYQQPPQSPKQQLRRKAGHITPSSSFTSAGQYLNSAQHRRVSHYISGISVGSPTSMSRRGSAANLSQLPGTPTTPGAQTIPSQPRSRRASYTTIPFQSPGHQSQSPMYSHHSMMIPPDSPPLGPVSLCSSPTKMFLAQTPPAGQYSRHWVSANPSHSHAVSSPTTNPSNVIDIIQEGSGDEEEPTGSRDQKQKAADDTVNTTAAAIAAALETEIHNSSANSRHHHYHVHQQSGSLASTSGSTPITIPLRSSEPDSPSLGPVMTPLETAPMTPMALDLQSQHNSFSRQQSQLYFSQLQGRQMSLAGGAPEGIMEVLNGNNSKGGSSE